MAYEGGGGSSRGTFHWTLDFTWEFAPRVEGQQSFDPIKSAWHLFVTSVTFVTFVTFVHFVIAMLYSLLLIRSWLSCVLSRWLASQG